MKTMTKRKLRTGMIVQDHRGHIGMVFLNTSDGDNIVCEDSNNDNRTWFPLKDLSDKKLFKQGQIRKVYDKIVVHANCDRASFDLKKYKVIWEYQKNIKSK